MYIHTSRSRVRDLGELVTISTLCPHAFAFPPPRIQEFREFIETLTTKQFEKIQKFYATAPKLSHTFTVINPNTGKESDYTIEGLQSFFA